MDYIVYIVLLIILVIFGFLILGTIMHNSTNNNSGSILSNILLVSQNILDTSYSVAITNKLGMKDITAIQKYCQSWNYTYINPINFNKENNTLIKFDTEKESIGERAPSLFRYILYLDDMDVNISLDRSLDIISHIGSNVKYIIFDDCKSDKRSYLVDGFSPISYKDMQKEIDELDLPPLIMKDILNEGYPCPTRNGILLHKSYLDYIFQNKIIPFNIPIIMPSKIQPRKRISTSPMYNPSNLENIILKNQRIPKIIHQTFETKCLPHGLAMASSSWINRNPEYEYKYYDDRDRREFIKNNFDSKVLSAYDSLIPGAYRADLWRYCVIYVEGGIYIDIKMGAIIPLTRIIPHDIDLLIVNDTHDVTLYNAFFAAIPKHPAILRTIEIAVERVTNKERGKHILYPTGPMAMGSAILPLYGFGNHATNGKHSTDRGIIQVYSHDKINGETVIVDSDSTMLVNTRYDRSVDDSYIKRITGRPHYRFLWNENAIYRE